MRGAESSARAGWGSLPVRRRSGPRSRRRDPPAARPWRDPGSTLLPWSRWRGLASEARARSCRASRRPLSSFFSRSLASEQEGSTGSQTFSGATQPLRASGSACPFAELDSGIARLTTGPCPVAMGRTGERIDLPSGLPLQVPVRWLATARLLARRALAPFAEQVGCRYTTGTYPAAGDVLVLMELAIWHLTRSAWPPQRCSRWSPGRSRERPR